MSSYQSRLTGLVILCISILLTACGGSSSGGGGGSSGATSFNLQLLADLNNTQTGPETRLRHGSELSGWLYFSSNDGINGSELWRTDGSTTEMVANINPVDSSAPEYLTVYNGWLYFSAHDGVNGRELWRSNGSTTEMVADIFPGAANSNPDSLIVFGGNLYFVANSNLNGDQLWRTDGSTITLITDLDNTDQDAYNYYFTELNGYLYFSARADSTGWEVWRTNGTGATRVTDVNTDTMINGGDSYPRIFIVLGNELFFNARDDTSFKLWRTDGATTNYVSDVILGAGASANKTVFNGWIYYSGQQVATGNELWRTNGTTTELYFDTLNGATNSTPNRFVELNGELFFNDANALYRTDGASTPTVVSGAPVLRASAYTVHNSYIYYSGNSLTKNNLWRTNGATSEMVGVDTVNFYAGDSPPITSFAGEVYFIAYNDNTPLDGRQWWRTSVAGVEKVTSINSQAYTGTSNPVDIEDVNGYTYILTDAAVPELWRTNGVSSEKITLNSVYEEDTVLTAFDNQLYFADFSASFGLELWRTDWIVTERVTDINPNAGSSLPQFLETIGSYLYFSADDGTNGQTLWRTDGITTEQVLTAAINMISNPGRLHRWNNYLYFSADDGSGFHLWRTNGGVPEKLLKSGSNTQVASPYNFTELGGNLFFTASDPDTGNGAELWATDGSITNRISNVNPTGGTLRVGYLNPMNGWMYFTVTDSAMQTRDLWRADTATASEQLALNFSDSELTAYNGHIYYSSDEAATGVELWRTDGTTRELFADLNPGPEQSWLRDLVVFKGQLIFIADDGGRNGSEVWRTNGTTTEIIKNIKKRGSSWPTLMKTTGNRMYFSIDDDINAEEPWYLEITN